MDVDTIIPSMLIKAGGTSIHLGILTAIMLGGSGLFQLFFASYLAQKTMKKMHLLLAINLRVAALFCVSLLFFRSHTISDIWTMILIFLFMSIFSFSGSFAGVSYMDILGKSMLEKKRKRFFSAKQIVNSIGFFISAVVVRELLKHYEYPVNYAILFFWAAILLLTATLGFWRIREIPSIIKNKTSFIGFFTCIPSEIKKNRNLKYYLLTINSLGLGLSLLPFIVLYAKVNFGLSYAMIGNFLLLRTIGMLIAGIVLYRYSNQFKYKTVLKVSLILGGLMPLLALLLNQQAMLYQFIFIFSGIFFASYRLALNGVLLEISTNENRAAYTGISGAGNILTTIFPLFAGVLVSVVGYHILFISVSVMVLLSYGFVTRLDCTTK